MKCCVDGCDRKADYKRDELCQMHYFRRRRNGKFDLVRKRSYRVVNPAGYHSIYEPGHPLSQAAGYVYEHRMVLFDAVGHSIKECEKCGRDWSWSAIFHSHVDHINKDKSDNRIDNLRPLCNSCNTGRSVVVQHNLIGRNPITVGEVTMTAQEWSRQDGVKVSGSGIRHRISMGMSNYDAVFGDKKTHNGRGTKRKKGKPKKHAMAKVGLSV